MTALGPGLVKVEVYARSAWNDVSAHVNLTAGVQITPAQRTDVFEDVEPGQADLTFHAHDGVMWPENPASPYSGEIVEGMPLRITVTIGSTTSVRHLGRIRLMQPAVAGDITQATLAVTSTDVLTDVAGITLADRLTENLKAFATTSSNSNDPNAWDVWPLTDDAASTVLLSSRPGGQNALIVPSKPASGTVTLGSLDGATTQGTWNLSGMATFAPTSTIGPVLRLPVTSSTAGQVYFGFRTSTLQDCTLAAGWDASGAVLWRLRILSAGTVNLYDSSNTLIGSRAFTPDGAWHTMVGYLPTAAVPSANTHIGWYLDGTNLVNQTTTPSALRWITIGGGMNPYLLGKQSSCFTGDIAMLGVAGIGQLGGVDNECAIITMDPNLAIQRITGGYTVAQTPAVGLNSEVYLPSVANFATDGMGALDALATIARSVGMQINVLPLSTGFASRIQFLTPELPTPGLTPSMTIALYADDDGQLTWDRGADNAPTRATASSPLATATYIGDESQRRSDASLDTVNAAVADAYAIAAGWVNRPRSSRLTPIVVDLATAIGGDTLAAAVLALKPMNNTATVANLPGVLTGRTTQDHIILAWTETWGVDSSLFSFSTIPADDWPYAIWTSAGGDHSYFGAGGLLTATNGASLGTGTGSLTVASSSGDLMVTGTSLTWSWGGEAVTGTASGSSSPQTLAITARGVNNTVARTHNNGESVDVWRPAVFGY